MKFLVPNYSCLQNPLLGVYHPQYPRFLCPLFSTEFVEPPLPRTKFLGTPLYYSDGFPTIPAVGVGRETVSYSYVLRYTNI